MQCISSNWQDIRKYYEHTYVKFNEFGDKLFYIAEVGPSIIRGIDDTQTDFELYLSDDAPYYLDYLLPHKAVFQYKDSVALLQRIPARQYRRGLCSDNTQILNVASGSKYDLGFPTLKAFVSKPSYASFSEAFNCKAKVKAVALSNRMTYMRTGQILIDHTTVAHYDYTTKKITMARPIFLPEIMQHMVDHNEVYEVIKP
jgi:hypothetical protein